LDHGPMLAIERTDIGPDERTPSLARRLSELGANALLEVLDELARGVASETPQDHASATLAPKIEKHEGEIRFDENAQTIYDRFRAFDPWPGISFQSIKLTDIRPAAGDAPPRTVLEIGDDVVVAAN